MFFKIFLIGSLIFTAIHSFSQNIAVAMTSRQIAYNGVANSLAIVVENSPCESLYVTTDNGNISGENCQYNYMPTKIGGSTIYVYKAEKNDTILIGKKYIQIVRVPLPRATIGAIYGEKIKASALKAQIGVVAPTDGSGVCGYYEITKYNFKIIRYGSLICDIENYGGRFGDKCLSALKGIKPGDKLIIDDIRVLLPGRQVSERIGEKLEDIIVEVE